MSLPPIVGITMGDPVGIGPEIIVKSLLNKDINKICRPLVIGDQTVISQAVNKLNAKITCRVITGKIEKEEFCFNRIAIFDSQKTGLSSLSYGNPDKETSKVMAFAIKEAVRLALDRKIDAIVTAPINKEALRRAGYSYPGHTEFLGVLTRAKNSIMMLAGDSLKVVLTTTHHPLKEVSNLITSKKILTTIEAANSALKHYFGIASPRIAVAALNPHGGEEGIFGDEEKRIISPAIKEAANSGIDVKGPFPSDSLFYQAIKGNYHLVVCMYHDQGMIPIKLLGFHNAVNVTLGLPIIRTSPDHGTAYDISGKGIADPSSMLRAIELAARMAKIRYQSHNDGNAV